MIAFNVKKFADLESNLAAREGGDDWRLCNFQATGETLDALNSLDVRYLGKPVGGSDGASLHGAAGNADAVRESDGRLPSAAAIPCGAGEEELIEDCDDSCQAREFALEHALRDAGATKATLQKSLDNKASAIIALQFEVREEAAKAATACEALRVEKLAHEKTADDKAGIEKALDEAYCEKLALAEAARVEIAALQELLEKATCEAATREKQLLEQDARSRAAIEDLLGEKQTVEIRAQQAAVVSSEKQAALQDDLTNAAEERDKIRSKAIEDEAAFEMLATRLDADKAKLALDINRLGEALKNAQKQVVHNKRRRTRLKHRCRNRSLKARMTH